MLLPITNTAVSSARTYIHDCIHNPNSITTCAHPTILASPHLFLIAAEQRLSVHVCHSLRSKLCLHFQLTRNAYTYPGGSVHKITREVLESGDICTAAREITYTHVVFVLVHAYRQSGMIWYIVQV